MRELLTCEMLNMSDETTTNMPNPVLAVDHPILDGRETINSQPATLPHPSTGPYQPADASGISITTPPVSDSAQSVSTPEATLNGPPTTKQPRPVITNGTPSFPAATPNGSPKTKPQPPCVTGTTQVAGSATDSTSPDSVREWIYSTPPVTKDPLYKDRNCTIYRSHEHEGREYELPTSNYTIRAPKATTTTASPDDSQGSIPAPSAEGCEIKTCEVVQKVTTSTMPSAVDDSTALASWIYVSPPTPDDSEQPPKPCTTSITHTSQALHPTTPTAALALHLNTEEHATSAHEITLPPTTTLLAHTFLAHLTLVALYFLTASPPSSLTSLRGHHPPITFLLLSLTILLTLLPPALAQHILPPGSADELYILPSSNTPAPSTIEDDDNTTYAAIVAATLWTLFAFVVLGVVGFVGWKAVQRRREGSSRGGRVRGGGGGGEGEGQDKGSGGGGGEES